MTADELSFLLQVFSLRLADIMSFGLGALCAIAFVIATHMRWF